MTSDGYSYDRLTHKTLDDTADTQQPACHTAGRVPTQTVAPGAARQHLALDVTQLEGQLNVLDYNISKKEI